MTIPLDEARRKEKLIDGWVREHLTEISRIREERTRINEKPANEVDVMDLEVMILGINREIGLRLTLALLRDQWEKVDRLVEQGKAREEQVRKEAEDAQAYVTAWESLAGASS